MTAHGVHLPRGTISQTESSQARILRATGNRPKKKTTINWTVPNQVTRWEVCPQDRGKILVKRDGPQDGLPVFPLSHNESRYINGNHPGGVTI